MKRRGRQANGPASEDQQLWRNVTKTVSPLHKRGARLHTASSDGEDWSEWLQNNGMIERDVIAETAATPEPTIPPKLQAPPRNVSAPPLKKRATGSTIHPIERPTHRKLAKGRLPIDARLDLHNLTQDQAHQRLLSFLGEAMQRGHRHVLVITGKGMSQNSQGILKKMLPVWLATPPFTHMVSGLKHASRDHGGEGAWYIRLKKNKSPN